MNLPPSAHPGTGAALARSAGSIGVATMTSRILGLVREQVLASLFGAGNAMDAFNVAFRIPNLVRDLFAEGAMSAAFVPTFTRRLASQGRASAWMLGNHVVTALLVVTGALVAAGIVFAGPLTRLLAAEYATVEGKLELTISLTRILLPFLTLVAVAAAFMGMLNALHRFFVPALAPAMFNLGTIASALLLVPLAPHLGFEPIVAIAIGTILGGMGQVAMQWPLLRREGYRYRPTVDLRDPGLREVLLLMGPGTIGLAATQVNLLVNTVLATGQGTGAVSWLNYAFRLMYLPIGVFGVSIATAAVPSISRHAALDDFSAVRRTVASALRMMLVLNVPATAGLAVLASPIVALIFERGRFTPDDTAAVAWALICYAPGLIGYSAVKIAVPSFYALGDSRTPTVTAVTTVAVNVALNIALVRVMGFRGLALGTALAALFNASALLWLLSRRLGGLGPGAVAPTLLRIAVASAIMAAAAYGVDAFLREAWPGRSVPLQTARLGLAIGFSLVVLAGAARLLRVREVEEAVRQVASRFARRRDAASS
jgi:putative peptidoglycan lipid II flippase